MDVFVRYEQAVGEERSGAWTCEMPARFFRGMAGTVSDMCGIKSDVLGLRRFRDDHRDVGDAVWLVAEGAGSGCTWQDSSSGRTSGPSEKDPPRLFAFLGLADIDSCGDGGQGDRSGRPGATD